MSRWRSTKRKLKKSLAKPLPDVLLTLDRKMKTLLPAAVVFCGLFAIVGLSCAQDWQLTSAPDTPWRSLACSADGTKLVASVLYYIKGPIYASINSGSTWFLTGAPTNNWTSVASSADGVKLVAAAAIPTTVGGGGVGGPIYTSTDSGTTWLQTSAPSNQWTCVASSADGSKLVAGAAYLNNSFTEQGLIFISTNSGASWTASGAPANVWQSVASSADGTRLLAAGGEIFISTNSGTTWTSNNIPAYLSVASSADGTTLIAFATQIYISTDSGNTWTSNSFPNIFGNWSVASSADGTRLMASGSYLYTSTNSGATWAQNNIPNQPYGWEIGYVASSADGEKLFLALGNDSFGHGTIYTYYSPPTPQLNLTASNSNLTCSWLVPSTNFVLQQSLDLTMANWVTLTNTPVLNLTNLHDEVTLSPTNRSGFYRLIAQ